MRGIRAAAARRLEVGSSLKAPPQAPDLSTFAVLAGTRAARLPCPITLEENLMRKLLAAAMLAALSTTAYAQGSPASDTNSLSTDRADKAGDTVGDRRPFDEIDTDDDGFIAKNEVQQDNELLTRFARFDDDG